MCAGFCDYLKDFVDKYDVLAKITSYTGSTLLAYLMDSLPAKICNNVLFVLPKKGTQQENYL